MADLAASGPLATKIVALQTLLSNSTWFQTWTGTADAAAAKARCIIGPEYADDGTTKPFVELLESEGLFQRLAAGDKTYSGGEIIVAVHGTITAAYANIGRDAYIEMLNDFGGLADAIIADANSPTYLAVRHVRVMQPPAFETLAGRSDATKRYTSWYGILSAAWGVQ